MSTPDLEPTSARALPRTPSPSPLVTVERTVADASPERGVGRHSRRSSLSSKLNSNSKPKAKTAPAPSLDDLPPLAVGVLQSDAEKAEALELVADSIAQQRQSAALHMIFHPYLLAALAAALAISHRVLASRPRRLPVRGGGLDLGTALMLYSGVIMTYLLVIRYFAGRYIHVAESMRWSWLVPPGDEDDEDDNGNSHSGGRGGSGGGKDKQREEDTVIGVRFGYQLIGALVLRLEPKPGAGGSGGKRRTRQQHNHQQQLRRGGGHGVIRAWTVARRYRGRGVGGDLLREAVRAARERCGRDADVGFAREHANGAPVLPEVFNGPLRRAERRAAAALDKVLAEWDNTRRHRRRKS